MPSHGPQNVKPDYYRSIWGSLTQLCKVINHRKGQGRRGGKEDGRGPSRASHSTVSHALPPMKKMDRKTSLKPPSPNQGAELYTSWRWSWSIVVNSCTIASSSTFQRQKGRRCLGTCNGPHNQGALRWASDSPSLTPICGTWDPGCSQLCAAGQTGHGHI